MKNFFKHRFSVIFISKSAIRKFFQFLLFIDVQRALIKTLKFPQTFFRFLRACPTGEFHHSVSFVTFLTEKIAACVAIRVSWYLIGRFARCTIFSLGRFGQVVPEFVEAKS